MGFINIDVRVRYEDVDKNNHLTLKGFLKYLVDAASAHSDIAGYGLDDIPKTHVAWLILDWKLKVYNYPKTSELIHIRTWTRNNSKLYSYRDFEVLDNTGSRIAIGSSKWVLVNYETKAISKITPEIIAAYNPENLMIFDKEIEKLAEPKGKYTNCFSYTILRRDLDTNNHVNNLNYIDFALEALPNDVYANISFTNIDIMYKKQCLLGDKINCLYFLSENNKHIIVIKSEDLRNSSRNNRIELENLTQFYFSNYYSHIIFCNTKSIIYCLSYYYICYFLYIICLNFI